MLLCTCSAFITFLSTQLNSIYEPGFPASLNGKLKENMMCLEDGLPPLCWCLLTRASQAADVSLAELDWYILSCDISPVRSSMQ